MPPPRRPLLPAEVEAVCAAYSLGNPVRCVLVREGTSSLYRMVCASSGGTRTVAVKVPDAGESMASPKNLEAAVLSAIRPAFPLVPALLRPGVPRPPNAQTGVGSAPWEVRRLDVRMGREPAPVAGKYSAAPVDRSGAKHAAERAERTELLTRHHGQGGSRRVGSGHRVPGVRQSIRRFGAATTAGGPLSGLDERQLGYLDDRLALLRRTLLGDWRCLTQHWRGLVHTDFTPGNCGYDDNDVLTIVFDFESVRLGVLPLSGAVAIGAFCINPEAAPQEVVAAMQAMVDELRYRSPELSPPPGLILPLLRLAYLDTVRRQLAARRQNPVRRWGFLREDLRNLRWLDDHASSVAEF
jgi:hypothetical protein